MGLLELYKFQIEELERKSLENEIEKAASAEDLKKLKSEHKRLYSQVTNLEEKLKNIKVQIEIANLELKNIECNKKEKENLKYSRNTDTLKKLEAVEKNIKDLDQKYEREEARIIKLMEEGENIEKKLIETKKKISYINKKYFSVKESLNNKIKELEELKRAKELAIEALKADVDDKLLGYYLELKNRLNDPVALVKKGLCMGCGMEISALDYDAIKKGSENIKCENCGRLLCRIE